MSSTPESTAAASRRSAHRHYVEVVSHILYRNAILASDATAQLPSDVLSRLILLGLGSDPHPNYRKLLNDLREQTKLMKSFYKDAEFDFYREALGDCQQVATLLMRLGKGFENAMRDDFRSQLRNVQLKQKRHDLEEAWVWVMEMSEEKPGKPKDLFGGLKEWELRLTFQYARWRMK